MKTLKLNWGAGIAVSYLGFVAMIMVLVVMSTSQKIDLVTSQYYTDELQFQRKIDKVKRTQALPQQLIWEVTDNAVDIQYPESTRETDLSGVIRFYSPSDDKNDRSFKVEAINGVQIVPVAGIPKGRYHLQIDWKSAQETYWTEGVIVINH